MEILLAAKKWFLRTFPCQQAAGAPAPRATTERSRSPLPHTEKEGMNSC